MRIEPPSKYEIVLETNVDHILRFLSAESKVCECGLKNHGWNRMCPSCHKQWETYIDVETIKRLRRYNELAETPNRTALGAGES